MLTKQNIKRLKELSIQSSLILLLAFTACDSQKRVTKALMKLDQDELNAIRPWPYNYNYYEYTENLDQSKLKIEFLEKRKLQAKMADDKKTALVLQDNIDKYEQDVKRLKKDKKFYKIYKLRSREIKIKLKADKKIQKSLAKQQKDIDKQKKAANQERNKSKNEHLKAQEARTNAKLEKLEEKQDIIKAQNNDIKSNIKKKENEIEKLKKQEKKADEDDKAYYQEEIDIMIEDLKVLKDKAKTSAASLDSMEIVIDKFMLLYYGNDSIPPAENMFNDGLTPYTVPTNKK